MLSVSKWSAKPLKLERGTFLICGDQARAGISCHLIGGPCTLGRLALASPNMTQIPNWQKPKIQKRGAISIDEYYGSQIYHWSRSKRIAVSVFLSWVAAAKALSELGHLKCWVTKQANLTSNALSDLLQDGETTRWATLQN